MGRSWWLLVLAGLARLAWADATATDGLVLDDQLRPVAGAEVVLARLDGEPFEAGEPRRALTDAEGRWQMTGLPAAHTRSFEVRAAGRALASLYVGAGWQPSPTSVAVLRAGGELLGRVLDPEGRPAAGVRLRVGWRQAVSGADGGYRVEGLPLGPTQLQVEAVASGRWWAEPRNVPIAAGPATVADLRLVPAGEISGQVLQADGRPWADALVWLGKPGGQTVARTRSDEQGRFVLHALPGDYTLRTGGYRQSDPVRITLRAGQAEPPVNLRRRPPTILRVTDQDGAPLAGASLRVASKWGPFGTSSTLTDAQGAAPLPDSLLTMGGQLVVWQLDPLRVGLCQMAEGPPVDIRLLPPASRPLAAHVALPDGQPVAGACVSMALQARWADGARTELGELWNATADATGVCRWPAVPNDWRATLRAEAPGHVAGAPLVCEPPQRLAELELRLTPAGNSVSGTVLDEEGRPAAGAAVFAEGHAGDAPAIADATGRFACVGLTAGRLTLLAMRGRDRLARLACVAPASDLALRLAAVTRPRHDPEAERDLARTLLLEVLASQPDEDRWQRAVTVLARIDGDEALDQITRLPSAEARAEAVLQLLDSAPPEVRLDARAAKLLGPAPDGLRAAIAAMLAARLRPEQAGQRAELLAVAKAARRAKAPDDLAGLADLGVAGLARDPDPPAAEAALRSLADRLRRQPDDCGPLLQLASCVGLSPEQIDLLAPALATDEQRTTLRARAVMDLLPTDPRAAWALASRWWPADDGGANPPAGEGGDSPSGAWLRSRLAMGLLSFDLPAVNRLLRAEPYQSECFWPLLEAALTARDPDVGRQFLAQASACYPASEDCWGARLALAADGLDPRLAERTWAESLSHDLFAADRVADSALSLAAIDPNRARWALEQAWAQRLPNGGDCGQLAIAMASLDLPRAVAMARACRAEEDAPTALACWLLAGRPARVSQQASFWLSGSPAPEWRGW